MGEGTAAISSSAGDGGQVAKRARRPAANQAGSASSPGGGKGQRRRAKDVRRARANIERSMRWARQERETRDRLLADMASRDRWGEPLPRPLGSAAGSEPDGVCRSCSRPISVTGQCGCS